MTRRAVLGRGALVAASGMAAVAGVTASAGAAGAAPAAGTYPRGLDPDRDRYLGYQPADTVQPYAGYMQSATIPMQDHVADVYFAQPTPSPRIPTRDRLADDLNRHGYSDVETGYGTVPGSSQVWAAVRTDLPGNTAAMWDWWFGWHSNESAKYRLWHPDAHGFAAIKRDLTEASGRTDRQRYVGNTSYVDEYIGGQLEQLAIRFLDPARAGLRTSADTTVVYATVGSSEAPVNLGYLAHQVRPTPTGAEMRSRFYLNAPGLAPVDPGPALAAHRRGDLPAIVQPLPFQVSFARSLMEHCAREMNHLAQFLPDLHADFGARHR